MSNRNEPKFSSEEEANRAYIAFGKVATFWGQLEIMLESALIYLRNRQGINTMKNFPGAFSQVADELVLRLDQEPMFAEHLDPVKQIIESAKNLHELRSVITHGVCDGTDLEGRVRFQKSKRRQGWGAKSYAYDLSELEQASERMLVLADELAPIHLDFQRRFLRAADGTLLTLAQRSEKARGSQLKL